MKTVLTIAAREYTERIKQKGFIIGTILGVLLIVGLSFMFVVFGLLSSAFTTSVAIVAPSPAVGAIIEHTLRKADRSYRLTVVPQPSQDSQLPAAVRDALEKKKYDAALVAYYNRNKQLAFSYYPEQPNALSKASDLKQYLLPAVIVADGMKRGNTRAENELNFPFTTVNLNKHFKSEAEQSQSQILVYFLLLLMYMSVILYGIYVAQGVIEEKSNRVMELMIGAVRPSQLLAGKIFGIGSLALTQLIIIGGASMLINATAAANFSQQLLHSGGAGAASSSTGLGILTVPLLSWLYLIVFFLLGFFTYATMFAGVGALASKPEDLQQTNSIFTLPIIVAYLLSLLVLVDPQQPVVVWGSLIPMLSPMVMFARVATSDVPAWQVAVAIAGSFAAIWLFTLLAGKLYRIGVLMYGKPLAPKEILRAIRAHT